MAFHAPFRLLLLAAGLGCLALAGCTAEETPTPLATSRILVTSEAGAKMETLPNVTFTEGVAQGGAVLTVWPDSLKQTIHGIGTSFTESSAFVLAHLAPAKRREVMEKIYGAEGADFTLTRTHIASCDFSVEGKYAYVEENDADLASFTIAPDREGFDPAQYPGIKDPAYDLLPMIEEAQAIKAAQKEKDLRIIASAWTAPPWMKDIETWFIPGSAENGWQGTGGSLKPEFEAAYADYLVQYLDAYAAEGVPVWGLTPVNEPHGNGGNWESMNFTAESQGAFIEDHLGPRLKDGGHGDKKLLIYDQNRDGVEHWADVIYPDPAVAPYVSGMAVHWYASTFKVFEEVLDRVHKKFPTFSIIHTEGTIDDLGKEAPGGILDPERFQESGWFDNDEFWWNDNATDWAYTATWAPNPQDHPIYTPVHRYARNIIVSLNHWMDGWIDWNIVLDQDGGPNHAGNFCGAPIMIDVETGHVYYTPIYYVLAQFSRTIRPGDRAVQATTHMADGLDQDALHASATLNDDNLLSVQLLNTTKSPVEYQLQIGAQHAVIEIAANSLQTVQVLLPLSAS